MNYTEATTTVELGGEERDVQVRAYVERVRLYGGSMGYRIDGDAQALIDGAWLDVDTLSPTPLDLRLIEEAICDAAECEPDFGSWSRRAS